MLQVKLLLFAMSNCVSMCVSVCCLRVRVKKPNSEEMNEKNEPTERPHLLNKYFNKIQNANALYLYTNTDTFTFARRKLTHKHTPTVPHLRTAHTHTFENWILCETKCFQHNCL